MPDKASMSTASPSAATIAPDGLPTPGGSDPLVEAFEAVRRAQPVDTDALEIAADDAGGTVIAEELDDASPKPAA